eukprot:308996-Chlamydomonas_euryale.AAC.4
MALSRMQRMGERCGARGQLSSYRRSTRYDTGWVAMAYAHTLQQSACSPSHTRQACSAEDPEVRMHSANAPPS